jgi:hypothetical protein
MWSAPNRQKLEANDTSDHTIDFLSLGERWSMSNSSLKRNCRIQNKPTQLKRSNSQFRTQKLVLRLVVKLSDITEKMCAILPQAAAQTHDGARL